MKSIYLLFIALSLVACDQAQNTAKTSERTLRSARKDSALAIWQTIQPTLAAKYDSLKKHTTYKDPIATQVVPQTSLTCWFAIQKDSLITPLYWELQFADESFVFAKSYTFFIDGKLIPYKPKLVRREYSKALQRVWETSTNVVTRTDLAMLEQIVDSKVTRIRFEGGIDKEEYLVTPAEKKAIANMIQAYKAAMVALGY